MTRTSHLRRHAGTAFIALLLVAGFASCSDDSTEERAASASTETVTIETFVFSPDPVTVPVGTTVVFENRDSTSHTITAGTRETPDTDRFDAELGPDETTEWTFDEPGTYDYFCAFHSGPGMTGEVIVTVG